MEIIQRNQCLITGKRDIEHIYTFNHFPIYMGCTDNLDPSSDLFADMKWGFSQSSGNVQLMELIKPDVLYSQHHNSGTIGEIWRQHHRKFYEFISKHGCSSALEIGGATGSLANLFLENQKNISWTVIEPSLKLSIKDPRITCIQGFFEDYNFNSTFDAVVHSHLFEHVYDPIKFLLKVRSLLKTGDSQFIALPNMQHWLAEGYNSTLTFEHTYYVDEKVLEALLANAGFVIADKVVEPHSIFVRCIKVDETTLSAAPRLDYVKDEFIKYTNRMKQDVATINTNIKNNNIFLFGAHVFSQTLLNLGINETQVLSILDNDPKKQNKRLYGTNLIVKSPNCLEGLPSPIIVVRSGIYTDEIKQGILKINPTAIFY
jgi:2-polyprenyl-3-methyl-5-hydroxy-6-metoxy-1,4-benzoquinol methylase